MFHTKNYVDRFPEIGAAGKVVLRGYAAADVIKSYPLEEAAESIMKRKCKTALEHMRPIPTRPVLPPQNQLKNLFELDLKKSRFEVFRDKFSEEICFRKPGVGKPLQLNSKPANVTNENYLFGKPVVHSETAYDVILPPKTPEQVNREYCEWHGRHIISHNHYFPSERINRQYDSKSFDPKSTFGKIGIADKTGRNVQRCLMDCDRMVTFSKAEKEFKDRTEGHVGGSLKKENYSFPKDKTFGIRSPADACTAQAVLENNICPTQTNLAKAIGHVNKLRHTLCERRDFTMFDFKWALQNEDKQKTGYLSFAQIVEVMKSLYLRLNENKLLTAIRHFKLIANEGEENERISIEAFCRLMHVQYPLPPIGNLFSMPPEIYIKDTTYRSLCSDRTKIPNELAERKIEREETLDNAKTTALDCISPDTPMLYGLLPSEFTMPRSKDLLRRFFKRLLTDKFDIIWARAQAKFNTDCVSIAQLKEELELYSKENKLRIYIE